MLAILAPPSSPLKTHIPLSFSLPTLFLISISTGIGKRGQGMGPIALIKVRAIEGTRLEKRVWPSLMLLIQYVWVWN